MQESLHGCGHLTKLVTQVEKQQQEAAKREQSLQERHAANEAEGAALETLKAELAEGAPALKIPPASCHVTLREVSAKYHKVSM